MKKFNELEFLQAARDLITDKSKWTTDVFARDAEGNEVVASDESATCFCTLGALWHVANNNYENYLTKCAVERRLWEYTGQLGFSIASFNDIRGHQEVLNMMDSIILNLKATDAGNAQ